MKKVLLFLSLLLTGLCNSLYAHDVAILATNIDMTVSGNTLIFYTDTGLGYDEWNLSDTGSMDGLLSIFESGLRVTYEQKNCQMDIVDITNNIDRTGLTDVDGTFTCEKDITNLENIRVRSTLFSEISAEPIDTFVTISLGESQRKLVLNSADPEEEVIEISSEVSTITESKEPTEGFWKSFTRFITIGVEHIVLGPDHVLFVLALILVISSYKYILALVSGFTIAHSLTLILAGLGKITLTASIVEPIIALSIVCMAGYNFYVLYRKKEKHINIIARFWITFGFGLFHGLGFAGSLADTPIPSEYLLPLLIAFNIGVELGQIAIIIITIPIIGYLLKKRTKTAHVTLLAITGIIILISLYWFIERVLG